MLDKYFFRISQTVTIYNLDLVESLFVFQTIPAGIQLIRRVQLDPVDQTNQSREWSKMYILHIIPFFKVAHWLMDYWNILIGLSMFDY